MVVGLKGELTTAWGEAQSIRYDVSGGVTSIDSKYTVGPSTPATTIEAAPGGWTPPTNG